MAKVLLALRALRRAGVGLEGKRVFDYGFGAGTFFRYCPRDAALFGVEQDPVVVEEVTGMLRGRGYGKVNLRAISIPEWGEHPLLTERYDVFLCSHVLEHLERPVEFLEVARRCLTEGGIFLGLVPINERAANPHHLQTVDRAVVERWASEAGLRVEYYEENDPFLYWLQPLCAVDSGWRHLMRQVVSLTLGLTSKLFGERMWLGFWAGLCGLVSKPTQAVFVLRALCGRR
jgi:SAM-dependent methyltransferase